MDVLLDDVRSAQPKVVEAPVSAIGKASGPSLAAEPPTLGHATKQRASRRHRAMNDFVSDEPCPYRGDASEEKDRHPIERFAVFKRPAQG